MTSNLLDNLFQWAAEQPSGNTVTVMVTISSIQSLSPTNETDPVVTYAQGTLTYRRSEQVPDNPSEWIHPSFGGFLNLSFSNRTSTAFKFDFQTLPFIRASTYLFDPNNTDLIGFSIYYAPNSKTQFPPPDYYFGINDLDVPGGGAAVYTVLFTNQVIYGAATNGEVVTIALGAQNSS